uniref:SCD domain-containing protein n=1 Tax=Schizophyllum commune (strain H4-8 / FGSC 9210) TaxID=578458 RepID=D8Q7N8_SCHCM
MSDSTAPRRSKRDRKTTQLFSSQGSNNKRRAGESETEADTPGQSDVEIDDPEEGGEDTVPADDEEEEEDYEGPAKAAPGAGRGKRKAASKPKEPRPVKKPRTARVKGTGTTTRRGRKPKEGEDVVFDAAQVEKDTKISSDNPLFNAILNPAAALQSTAEDFLESLNSSPGHAQAELVNLILRCCGCNDSVNEDEAVDYDGVVDALDNFTEALKQDNSPTYPLTSKLPIFKKFRKSLSEFIERLIVSAADLGSLYTSDLMPTLQTWVVPMSSSQIRSFRHTATVLAMEAETALCAVAAKVEKEAEVIGRQREGEKKRKAASAAKGKGAREKELESKLQEVRSRRNKLAEYLKEFVDGVFVHRYRDLDPTIRAECIHALGVWFKKHPSTFLDTSYLRYVGWVLSDNNHHVRLEAVRSLQHVYAATSYLTSLNHFTERFKPRLIEMATSDIEVSVRIAVIQVLSAIDDASLLEDDERDKLCLLIFDPEARVRKAVSEFVAGAWKESVDERLVGVQPSSSDKSRIGIKALAILLVRWGQTLDADSEETESQQDAADDDVSEAAKARRKEVGVLLANSPRNRITLAVDALWDVLDSVQDWEGLLDLLLLDHTAAEEAVGSSSPSKRRRANEKNAGPEAVNDAWRLDDEEETILLQVFVAAVSKARAESVGGKKGEEEKLSNDITRALITGLPRLFAKYQADHTRVAEVLLLPTMMNLDLYLEMRKVPAYGTLWDEVNKLFLSQTAMSVLVNAAKVIYTLMDATALSNTNSTKIVELEDELSTSLRDVIAGRDEIEVAVFSEDEVLALTAICTRLAVLSGCRDLSGWVDENEGGKQSSAWDILMALSERGRMGHKEEETMIEQALTVLSLHIFWKAKGLTIDSESSDDTRYRDTLREQRDSLLQKLVDFSFSSQSNTVDGVKRAAFKQLLNIHVLFATGQTRAADGAVLPLASIPVTLDDEVQYRCAGFIQAEVEQYAESMGRGQKPINDDGSDSESEEEDEEDRNVVQGMVIPLSFELLRTDISRAQLEKEYVFVDVITTYLRAIRAGVIDLRHCAVLLAHYGRFGANVDSCSKVVLDSLRQECRRGGDTELVVSVITEAIREAFDLVLGGYVADESNALSLAKLLATAMVIRGAQLAVVHSMDVDHIVQIHTDLLDWIGKRLAGYQANSSRRLMRKALTFFRVLTPLVVGIKPEDGLRIKAHMDQVLAEAKVASTSTAKEWDAHKAYEKRLGVSTARPRATGKGRGRPRKGKSAAAVVTDDEGHTTEEEAVVVRKTPTRPRPRARPRRAAAKRNGAGTDGEASQAEQSDVEPEGSPAARETTTPRASKTYGKSPRKRPTRGASNPPTEEETTPRASRKRGRSVVEEEDEEGAHDESAPVQSTEEPPSSPGEVQIRRKRVRR